MSVKRDDSSADLILDNGVDRGDGLRPWTAEALLQAGFGEVVQLRDCKSLLLKGFRSLTP
jgi:hypothetical protein